MAASCFKQIICLSRLQYFNYVYLQSCRHEGWSSVAKFLTEDVPLLLKSEDLKDIQEVLSVVFKSPPSELREFITWVAEVRRQENGKLTLSEEEKGRLAIKVLKLLTFPFKGKMILFLNLINMSFA